MKNNCVVSNIDDVLGAIRAELKKRGLSQGWLAMVLEKSEGWMSRIVRGDIPLTVQTLLDIAKVLEIDPAKLIPVDDETRKKTLEQYFREIVRDEIARDKEVNQKS